MDIRDLIKGQKKSSKKQTAKNVAIGASIGTAVGVAAGILLAPKSGKETRQDIADASKKAYENVKDTVSATKEKIEEAVKAKCCEKEAQCSCDQEETQQEAKEENL